MLLVVVVAAEEEAAVLPSNKSSCSWRRFKISLKDCKQVEGLVVRAVGAVQEVLQICGVIRSRLRSALQREQGMEQRARVDRLILKEVHRCADLSRTMRR